MRDIGINASMILLLLMVCWPSEGIVACDTLEIKGLLETAQEIRVAQPDSSSKLLGKAIILSLDCRDTLQAISLLLRNQEINSNRGRYHKVYEDSWQIILLAEQAGLEDMLAFAYTQLGRNSGYLKRREKAIEYFDVAQTYVNKLMSDNKSSFSDPILVYKSRVIFHLHMGEADLAAHYLDSCRLLVSAVIPQPSDPEFSLFQAKIYSQKGQFEKALGLLDSIGQKDVSQPMIPAEKGLIYLRKGNLDAGELWSLKALQIIGETGRNKDYAPLIYERLAEIYRKQGAYRKALDMTQKAKEEDFRIFDSRSENNQDLFEVQDEIIESRRRQEALLQEQKAVRTRA